MHLAETARTLVEYRGLDSDIDDFMGVPIRRFNSVDEMRFDLDAPARYIVLDPRYTLPIDFFFLPRRSKRLMVAFHGAEGRANANLPRFQFVTSLRLREESVLAVSDSTLLQSQRLTIGWFAGNQETPLADIFGDIITRAAAALEATETVLVGHSAGGLSAIRVGMRVPNSRAIAVNGQTVAMRHRAWVVSNLQKDAFPECGSARGMVDAYPDRFDLRAAVPQREATSSFTFFGHREDRLTFGESPHFQLFAESFGLDESGGRTAQGDAFVPCSWESKDPNPHALPGTVMPFVELVLGEKPIRDIEYTVNPGWLV